MIELFRLTPGRWRSLATAAARVSGVIMMWITMALAARRLSGEAFGFWAICFTVMNLGMALDGGFRYGLGNRMAALTAEADSEEEQQKTFWAVFHLESLIGLIGFIFCLGVLPGFDWAEVFKIQSEQLGQQVQWVFPLACGLVMLNQPLAVAATVFFARQEIVFVSLLGIVQSGVLLLIFGMVVSVGKVPWLVLSFLGGYLFCGLGVTLLLVRRYGWPWRWAPWREQWGILRSLLRPSRDFFVLSLASTLAGFVGPFVAGAVGGLAVAGDFTLIQKIFGFLVTLHLALLAPLAPAYTYHARQGDWEWIKNKLRMCVGRIWPLMFVAGGGAIWLGHPLILRLWTGRWITDYGLAGWFALGVILMGWVNTYSVLLNSLGIVRRQAVLSVVMLIPLIGLPIVLGKFWGVHGVAVSAVGCVLPGVLLYVFWVRSVIDKRCMNL